MNRGRDLPNDDAENAFSAELPLSPDESQTLVAQARDGDQSALGELLEKYRGYLRLVADQGIEPPLRAKIGGSDLVQETFAEAHRDFPQFRGVTPQEFHNWLLQILNRNLQDVRRRFGRQKRDVNREVQDAGRSTPAIDQYTGEATSPSGLMRQREQDVELEKAIAKLSDRHRQVIGLRHSLDLSFSEIGKRMNISEAAARKLWARAVQGLQKNLEGNHDQ